MLWKKEVLTILATSSGDPHATTRADGTIDPEHISGVMGTGSLKRSQKATSFHFYPKTGELIFSNPKYPPVRLDAPDAATETPQGSEQK
jgi:hypothetical protein